MNKPVVNWFTGTDCQGVPVSFVHVVPGGDPWVSPAQLRGKRWFTFEVDAGGVRGDPQQRKHFAGACGCGADFDDSGVFPERVVFVGAVVAETQGQESVTVHGGCFVIRG